MYPDHPLNLWRIQGQSGLGPHPVCELDLLPQPAKNCERADVVARRVLTESKWSKNALVAGAAPRTPLRELTALPLAGLIRGTGKGPEGKGKRKEREDERCGGEERRIVASPQL